MSLDFQRMQREFREDLNLRRNQELPALFERANRVIRQIAEAEKFDLILQEAVYRSPAHRYHGQGAQGARREQIAAGAPPSSDAALRRACSRFPVMTSGKRKHHTPARDCRALRR